jgi:hypothetical protein
MFFPLKTSKLLQTEVAAGERLTGGQFLTKGKT